MEITLPGHEPYKKTRTDHAKLLQQQCETDGNMVDKVLNKSFQMCLPWIALNKRAYIVTELWLSGWVYEANEENYVTLSELIQYYRLAALENCFEYCTCIQREWNRVDEEGTRFERIIHNNHRNGYAIGWRTVALSAQ